MRTSNVKGLDTVARNLNKALGNMEIVSLKALEKIGLDLASRSMQLAPIDTGDLRGSCSVQIGDMYIADAYRRRKKRGRGVVKRAVLQHHGEVQAGLKPVVTVGYGVPYAMKMHEDMSYTPKEPGTGQKFLEVPLTQNYGKYIKLLQRGVKEGLR